MVMFTTALTSYARMGLCYFELVFFLLLRFLVHCTQLENLVINITATTTENMASIVIQGSLIVIALFVILLEDSLVGRNDSNKDLKLNFFGSMVWCV